MQTLDADIDRLYGGAVRVRVCGICIQDERILLVNHRLYGPDGTFWSPPGGGVEFGENAHDALIREFREETGLDVRVGKLLFVNEHIRPPLHAIELFFEIESFTGHAAIGTDPELGAGGQIIREVRFLDWSEIHALAEGQCHRILQLAGSLEGIFKLSQYITADQRPLDH